MADQNPPPLPPIGGIEIFLFMNPNLKAYVGFLDTNTQLLLAIPAGEIDSIISHLQTLKVELPQALAQMTAYHMNGSESKAVN
jgi:hypothetical protein